MMNLATLLANSPEGLTPEQVRRLGQALGGLAPWWLRPDVLARFEEERGWRFSGQPPLPRTHGSCWIVMVQSSPQPWPALRDAFFLPLQWQKRPDWDERLPEQLLVLAKELAVELERTDYTLHLHADLQPAPAIIPPPPGGFKFDSAAVSLAGGLYLAAKNGEPDPAIGASACWKKAEGVLGVDMEGLKKKLNLASAWGMRAFFVAREQAAAARACGGRLAIFELPQGRSKLETALQNFVVHQKAEPAQPSSLEDEDGLQRCLQHWAFLPAGHKEAFYHSHLYPWVLARFTCLLRRELDVARGQPLRALVTIVSGQKDTTILNTRALSHLGIEQCLLLYSVDENEGQKKQEEQAIAIKQELTEALASAGQQWPIVCCEPYAFDPKERLLKQLANGIRAFCSRFPADQLVLDLTGGKSLMKWVADHAMPAESWRFCMENDKYIGNRAEPLTERPLLWRES